MFVDDDRAFVDDDVIVRGVSVSVGGEVAEWGGNSGDSFVISVVDSFLLFELLSLTPGGD